PPFDMQILSAKGSLFATRPTLMTYVARREDLVANATELFDMIGKGAIRVGASRTYPLRDAAQAHRDLEGRRTTGSVVLTV
ncbi:MAG TPA: zinc-binding dehydrogenase, partial [Hyphomicrobium sp.]|nr:zinc-binding dehydrogenase [Hyphomicrobium sp.]